MTTGVKAVWISHNGIDVKFCSSDEREISAVRNCFDHVWRVSGRFDGECDWIVISEEVPVISEPAAGLLADLYKVSGVPRTEDGPWQSYHHRIRAQACQTSFNLQEKTIRFRHVGPIDEYGYSYIRNLIREPIAAWYEQSGFITMHASACVISGAGIMMPGLKGAGKSTLLGHLLERGAQYVGNDAVLCDRVGDTVTLTAFPQCVRMSQETVDNNPMLSGYFKRSHQYAIVNEKLEFLPRLFDDMRPGHCAGSPAPLKLILVPKFSLSTSGFALEAADHVPSEVLEGSLFYPCHNYTWSPFFADLNKAADRPAFDVVPFFEGAARAARLSYGVLDGRDRARLYEALAAFVEAEPGAASSA